jgi:heme/copper-type cytochrome/quinol oxidase subunit 3
VSVSSAAENQPFGLAHPVPAGPAIGPEPADVGARALSIATRLLTGATTFFFLAFVFAYFYLRSLNQEHFWKPTAALLKEQKEIHVSLTPNQGLGAAFIACVVVSALLAIIAGRQMKGGSRSWPAAAVGAVVLGLAAVGLQCVEFVAQHFGPTDGAYASVFCAWTGFYLVAVVFTMYWLETEVASEWRARKRPATGSEEIKDVDTLIAPSLDAAVFYWGFLAGIGILTYVTLYLL